jgi:hypothetical protein
MFYSLVRLLVRMKIAWEVLSLAKPEKKSTDITCHLQDCGGSPAILITPSGAYLIDHKVDWIYIGTRTGSYSYRAALMESLLDLNVAFHDS